MKRLYKNVIIGENLEIGEYVIIGIPPRGHKDGELTTIIGDNLNIQALNSFFNIYICFV